MEGGLDLLLPHSSWGLWAVVAQGTRLSWGQWWWHAGYSFQHLLSLLPLSLPAPKCTPLTGSKAGRRNVCAAATIPSQACHLSAACSQSGSGGDPLLASVSDNGKWVSPWSACSQPVGIMVGEDQGAGAGRGNLPAAMVVPCQARIPVQLLSAVQDWSEAGAALQLPLHLGTATTAEERGCNLTTTKPPTSLRSAPGHKTCQYSD